MEKKGWKTISSKQQFANDHLEVVDVKMQTPTRSEPRAWTIVHRKKAVIVAPMTREGKILLIKQERVPIQEAIWEMPAGQIDNGETNDEEIRKIALRELREETGYQLAEDGELIELGRYFSSPGFTDEFGYLFLARPVERSPEGDEQEETESILDCCAFEIADIRRMIADNEIRDANTLGICARLATRGLISLDPRGK
jgi:ADP-ribose pyrophosphatase